MTSKIVSEEELTQRLKKAGKNDNEIQELLNKYTQTTSNVNPDNSVIADLLNKNKENAVLRVKGFNLSIEQYDALHTYFADSKLPNEDGFTLVQKALDEFVKIIQ